MLIHFHQSNIRMVKTGWWEWVGAITAGRWVNPPQSSLYLTGIPLSAQCRWDNLQCFPDNLFSNDVLGNVLSDSRKFPICTFFYFLPCIAQFICRAELGLEVEISTPALPSTGPVTRAACAFRVCEKGFCFLLLIFVWHFFLGLFFWFTAPMALPTASPTKFQVSTICLVFTTYVLWLRRSELVLSSLEGYEGLLIW